MDFGPSSGRHWVVEGNRALDAVEAPSVWRRGLSWIEGHRRDFALAPGPPSLDDLFPLKMLAELARIADVLVRHPRLPDDVRARVRALLDFGWAEFGEGHVLSALLEARPYAVLGTIYSIFEANGYRHPRTRELLAQLSRPGRVSAQQFPPRSGPELSAPAPFGKDAAAVLALALAQAWRQMGLPSPWSEDRLFPLTWLSRRPPVPALSDPEAYSLTHVVFFMTDFGYRREGLDPECRFYLGERCLPWMEDQRRRSNLDLYSELAMVLSCVGKPVPLEVESTLAQVQAPDGMVPGPGFRSRRRLEGIPDPERRRFVENYHTTLAGILASFAAAEGGATQDPASSLPSNLS